MGLDFPTLLPQVDGLGRSAAERARDLAAKVPQALQALAAAAKLPREELGRLIGRAGGRWPGALPTSEPIDAVYPCPPHPERLNIVAADGSQVYPDRHGLALFYLINIGSIRIEHGSGLAPEASSTPRILYEEGDLFGEDEGLIPSALVDGQRDAAELAELARRAEACGHAPTLAILDNGLLLWLALQMKDSHRGEVGRVLSAYLEQLGRLQAVGAAVAGFVDRPRNANVLALLHLASLTVDEVSEEALRVNPWRGLTDRTLFAQWLRPGERSARFEHASPVNEQFRAAGHAVEFFYLCCGEDQIARVEVPSWVGADPERMAIVHSGIIQQCHTPEGFPYALVRAHELAVVSVEDRRALEGMLAEALLRHGLPAQPSQKSMTKQWTGARRRHRL
jgi:hypothetical protein